MLYFIKTDARSVLYRARRAETEVSNVRFRQLSSLAADVAYKTAYEACLRSMLKQSFFAESCLARLKYYISPRLKDEFCAK